ncbi:hypothetical protein J3458_002013 [Metarhizium acridum]|uniref:uncharacterized protein n=1 Tax=Metarhizium acridum TaxID=92637 RepID=UPI001C6AE1F1|nr:hypothetical protein J3458_002013 [Metarhizium acridum]
MDPNGDKVDGKALPWTEEAKFQFLIRIVAQLRENGRSINWQKIDMPGRTVKSMQNMWTKINKMIAEVEAESGDAPITRPTPRKRTPKRSKGTAASDDEDELSTPAKSPQKAVPQKRACESSLFLVMGNLGLGTNSGIGTSRGGSAKKLKKGAEDMDGEEDMVLKPEPEVDL